MKKIILTLILLTTSVAIFFMLKAQSPGGSLFLPAENNYKSVVSDMLILTSVVLPKSNFNSKEELIKHIQSKWNENNLTMFWDKNELIHHSYDGIYITFKPAELVVEVIFNPIDIGIYDRGLVINSFFLKYDEKNKKSRLIKHDQKNIMLNFNKFSFDCVYNKSLSNYCPDFVPQIIMNDVIKIIDNFCNTEGYDESNFFRQVENVIKLEIGNVVENCKSLTIFSKRSDSCITLRLFFDCKQNTSPCMFYHDIDIRYDELVKKASCVSKPQKIIISPDLLIPAHRELENQNE